MKKSKYRKLINLVLLVLIVGLLSSVIVKGTIYLIRVGGTPETKRNLAQIRSIVALEYTKNVDEGRLFYPSRINDSDFENNAPPMNWLNFNRKIQYVTEDVIGSSPKSETCGWWYNSATGRVEAYSDGKTDVSGW